MIGDFTYESFIGYGVKVLVHESFLSKLEKLEKKKKIVKSVYLEAYENNNNEIIDVNGLLTNSSLVRIINNLINCGLYTGFTKKEIEKLKERFC